MIFLNLFKYFQGVAAAKQAFQKWGYETTAKERGAILQKWYQLMVQKEGQLAEILTREQVNKHNAKKIKHFRENPLPKLEEKSNIPLLFLIGIQLKLDAFMVKSYHHQYSIDNIFMSENLLVLLF